MTRNARTLLFVTVPALALAACGAQPTAEEYDDVAAGVSALVAENPGSETTAIDDGIESARGELPSGLTRSGMGTITGKRGALTYSFELTCTDVAGDTLAPCDETTDGARLVLDIDGEVDTARWDASLQRDGDWTLTGLTTETATLDGQGSFDVQSEFQAIFRNETRTFMLDYDARYEGVQIRMADHALLGGTVTYDVHAKRTKSRTFRDVEREIDVNAVVTFDGTGQAELVLDAERHYAVDLKGGTVELME